MNLIIVYLYQRISNLTYSFYLLPETEVPYENEFEGRKFEVMILLWFVDDWSHLTKNQNLNYIRILVEEYKI